VIGGSNNAQGEAGSRPLVHTHIFSSSERQLIDPSGRADALLSCWRLQLIMQLSSVDGWIHGSIAGSPSGSRGHGPQRVPVGRARAARELALSPARDAPIDRALFSGDQWAGRGLDLQLTIDLTAHQMVAWRWPIGWWHAAGGASAAGGSRAGRLRDSSN
jgi:hypothetical protein